MIDNNGWFDWAIHIPSGYNKLWPNVNSLQGYIPHSAVGHADDVTAQQANDAIAKTVHGCIRFNGEVLQYLPVFASPWASGSFKANTNFVAFENEGGWLSVGYDQPLTPEQVDSNVRIIIELGEYKHVDSSYWHRPVSAADLHASLYEHNECTRFGSLPTACPSGRIPWPTILERLKSTMKDGWIKEEPFWILYNDGVPVERVGATDDGHKGRHSYNYGGNWLWLRHINDDGSWDAVGYLSDKEGD